MRNEILGLMESKANQALEHLIKLHEKQDIFFQLQRSMSDEFHKEFNDMYKGHFYANKDSCQDIKGSNMIVCKISGRVNLQ